MFIPISEEMCGDSPAVRAYINTQLPLLAAQAEEKKLANEIYTAATGVALSTTIGGTDAVCGRRVESLEPPGFGRLDLLGDAQQGPTFSSGYSIRY